MAGRIAAKLAKLGKLGKKAKDSGKLGKGKDKGPGEKANNNDRSFGHNNKNGEKNPGDTAPKGGTYILKDADGKVVRTGRSKDLERRRREHADKDLDFEVDRKTDNYDQQRGREQIIYDLYPEAQSRNGGLNKRRAVSPFNPKRGRYKKAGEQI